MTDGLPIRVSGLKFPEPVGKRLDRLADGSIRKTPLLGARAKGAAVINEAFATATEAFNGRVKAGCTIMFFAGTYDAGVANGELAVPQAALPGVRDVFEAADWVSIVGFTKDYLDFRPGPGLLRIDIDRKDPDEVAAIWPEEPFRLEKSDDVVAAADAMLPEARGCPTMVAPSSGSMIVDTETGALVKGPGGWRVLIVVDDATQIPRILETIHLRCWAREEFRYAYVNDNGSFYARSMADLYLARPTQPDYVAADFGPGLARAPDASAVYDEDGPWLAAAAVVLSDEDRDLAARNIEAARAILAPKAKKLRAQAIRKHADELVRKGVPKDAAVRASSKKFEAGVLTGSSFIQLDDGSEIAASVLLTPDGETYDGRLCHDPVEPDYDGGRCVGKIYWNEGLRPGVHSYAHGTKFWKIAHDAETAAKAIDDAGLNADTIALALALADLEPIERSQLEKRAAGLLGLGNERKSLRESVERQRQRCAARAAEHADPDDDAARLRTGPMPLDTRLARTSFPRIEATKNGIKVLDHADNIAHMLDSYGIRYRYNVILKDIDWQHPDIIQGGDNAETALYSQMLGLCALNKVPIINLLTHLTALADRNRYNPVVEHLASLTWDGTPRFDALADAMQASDAAVARIVSRLFLIQACAAGDNAELARKVHLDYRPSFEGCEVLVGIQGVGKTKGIRKLLPSALRHYFKEGVTLDLKNKDSVTAAVSCWIAELGELESSFRKSDIAELKAFLSRDVDEIRAPYARKRSLFARRTAFSGTVNDFSFLADETGNRRFWPLTVGKLEIGWSDSELEQLWAEAWLRYVAGETWWPSADEERLLAANAERYRYRSGLEEAIESTFQWGRQPDWKAKRWTASRIYEMVRHRAGIGPLTASAVKTIGATLSRLWRESGVAETRSGALVVADKSGEWVKLNADAGKNRGWLLPPIKTELFEKSGLALLDGGKVDEEG